MMDQQANKNSLNFSSDRAQRPKDLRVDSRRCDLRRPWRRWPSDLLDLLGIEATIVLSPPSEESYKVDPIESLVAF